MRPIDADEFLNFAGRNVDMQDLYLPIHIKEFVIDEMPTLDVAPRPMAKWWRCPLVQSEFPVHGYMARRCSACRQAFYQKTPYCPWCGARMENA